MMKKDEIVEDEEETDEDGLDADEEKEVSDGEDW